MRPFGDEAQAELEPCNSSNCLRAHSFVEKSLGKFVVLVIKSQARVIIALTGSQSFGTPLVARS
jgi:hypothetical protein